MIQELVFAEKVKVYVLLRTCTCEEEFPSVSRTFHALDRKLACELKDTNSAKKRRTAARMRTKCQDVSVMVFMPDHSI